MINIELQSRTMQECAHMIHQTGWRRNVMDFLNVRIHFSLFGEKIKEMNKYVIYAIGMSKPGNSALIYTRTQLSRSREVNQLLMVSK